MTSSATLDDPLCDCDPDMLKCCSIDPAGGGVKPNEPRGGNGSTTRGGQGVSSDGGRGWVANLLQLHLIT